MKIYDDNEVDAVYIKLGDASPEGVTEISAGINLDITTQWIKKSSPCFEVSGEYYEYHWYEHPSIGRVEIKQKPVS
jgi:hypothetical protein